MVKLSFCHHSSLQLSSIIITKIMLTSTKNRRTMATTVKVIHRVMMMMMMMCVQHGCKLMVWCCRIMVRWNWRLLHAGARAMPKTVASCHGAHLKFWNKLFKLPEISLRLAICYIRYICCGWTLNMQVCRCGRRWYCLIVGRPGRSRSGGDLACRRTNREKDE